MRYDQIVIVADDNGQIRDLLRGALAHPRRALFFAANGIEAVQFAQSTSADLVLLDVDMPRLDGIAACARIRGLPLYSHVPIVFLTAFHDEAHRRKALRAGATGLLAKPFSLNDLRGYLRPLLPDPATT